MKKIVFTFVLQLSAFTAIVFSYFFVFFRLFSLDSFIRRLKGNLQKRILYLENQTADNAGAFFRVEIVAEKLRNDGYDVYVQYPFTKEEFLSLRRSDLNPYLLNSKLLLKKLFILFSAPFYDCIIIRREFFHQFQYGGLIFEKSLKRINNKLILDMDDYMPDIRSVSRKKSFSLFNVINHYKPQKTVEVISLVPFHTVASDDFKKNILETTPLISQESVYVFPMCVDYAKKLKKYTAERKIKKVGWLSQKVHFYKIDYIVPYLNKVYQEIPYELVIIADQPYSNANLVVPVINKKWSREEEYDMVLDFDIGISPQPVGDEKLKRKGTFKLIQYMFMGLATLTTSMPYVEQKLINDGENGFLVKADDEWYLKLKELLLLKPDELQQIGNKAYQKAYKDFHIDSCYPGLKQFYNFVINSNVKR